MENPEREYLKILVLGIVIAFAILLILDALITQHQQAKTKARSEELILQIQKVKAQLRP